MRCAPFCGGLMTNTTTHDAVARWLLAATIDDARRLLERNCETAYRHPYGFDVCRTNFAEFPGWTIRIHLWPNQAELSRRMLEEGTEHQGVHCHGWDLKTKVLLGAIRE